MTFPFAQVITTFTSQSMGPYCMCYAATTNDAYSSIVLHDYAHKEALASWSLTLTIGYDDEQSYPLSVLAEAPYHWDLDTWLQDQLAKTPGFNEDGENEDEDKKEEHDHRDYVFEALHTRYPHARERDNLVIYSFGKRHRRRVQGSQANFNAAVLSGRRRGLNLKKMNGLSKEVQHAVQTSRKFDTFMSQLIEKVERDTLTCISISCTAGRHRSVTCAELLKRYMYPLAIVHHVELKRTTR